MAGIAGGRKSRGPRTNGLPRLIRIPLLSALDLPHTTLMAVVTAGKMTNVTTFHRDVSPFQGTWSKAWLKAVMVDIEATAPEVVTRLIAV